MSIEPLPDVAALLHAVERYPASVRAGSDSLVLLYWWRRAGGDDAGFAAAVHELLEQGSVEIVPGPDMALRLTEQGFSRLDGLMEAEDEAPDDSVPVDAEDAAWVAATSGSAPPPAELRNALVAIFRVLGAYAGRRFAAGTLARIWAMDRRRGGDLRTAVDLMIAAGELDAERGARTSFVLTERGVARVAGALRDA